MLQSSIMTNLGLGLDVGLGLGFCLGRVQPVFGPSTAVYTGCCKDSPIHGTRLFTWPVYYSRYMVRLHGRVHEPYTAVYGSVHEL